MSRLISSALSCALSFALASSFAAAQGPPQPGPDWPADLQKQEKKLVFDLGMEEKRHDIKFMTIHALELGDLFGKMSDWNAVIFWLRPLVALNAGNPAAQAAVLNNLATAQINLSQTNDALANLQQSLTIWQSQSGKPAQVNQAKTLRNLGRVYSLLYDYDKAEDSLKQGLALSIAAGNKLEQTADTESLGVLRTEKGDLQGGVTLLTQALAMARELKNQAAEGTALINLGAAQVALGQDDQAKQAFQAALTIEQAINNPFSEANALNNLATINSRQGDYKLALQQYDAALAIYRRTGRKGYVATALANEGFVNMTLGNREKAAAFYQEGLVIARDAGNRTAQAQVDAGLGMLYQGTDNNKAIQYYGQALPLAKAQPLLEAAIFARLCVVTRTSQPTLAIFFGKQAVNDIERVRQNITTMTDEVKNSFLDRRDAGLMPITDYYRNLAQLLAQQNRLSEAQQVLGLLKQQEFASYTDSLPPTTSSAQPEITPTPPPTPRSPTRSGVDHSRPPSTAAANATPSTVAEEQAQKDYEQATAQIVTIAERFATLKGLASRTPDQEQEYQRLAAQLSKADQGTEALYKRLYVAFGTGANANKLVGSVKSDVTSLTQNLALMPRTVALYTIVGDTTYTIILVTASISVVRTYPIGRTDLEKRVDDFRAALQEPELDPHSLGKELYDILIGPIQRELAQAHAQTLVWVLDGKLRYLPMNALYDGKQYLIKNYQSVGMLPIDFPHMTEKPDMTHINISGMGISAKYDSKLDPLPGVVDELNQIVKDPSVKGSNGIIPGTLLINSSFTERAFEDQLRSRHLVVHIASHFVAGKDGLPDYLLLAGKDQPTEGYHLTVFEFLHNQKLGLRDTELLTLSACDTGLFGKTRDGREVDGLATIAQEKGAKSVISSLWNVRDTSTSTLMADFYQRWVAGHGKVQKVEALRQAQIDLLDGKSGPDFSHPFFWAPFVLVGNWQ
ncbi:CHAT domain-containing protein [Granulicella sibirica]|uniref:CHAT domain-containing protein n=1 Tax=Granulicella sibirica TaxID=2479048 RepID=A0A4Q0SYJ6_9BACT|nr:CHAT domain-containing protein [Granulicella sibirica]RXH55482.1 hypothetical protein GRAN_2339 [Granulicella sibirica]